MQGWTWRTIIFGAVVTVLVYTATRPDPETEALYSSTPAELVDSLGSSRESVRRHAAARMLARGQDSLPAIIAKIPDADDEELEQLFLVLEDLYVSTDPAVADAAEIAIDQLAADRRKEVRRATEDLFQANYTRRYMRACEKLEELGAKLISSPFRLSGGDLNFPLDIAVIDDDWTGGDAGLKYLMRIRGLVSVHVSEHAQVSPDAVEDLLTFVSIRRENEACCLGVEFRYIGDQLVVRRLVPDSPAERAGLVSSDRLISVSGVPIINFGDFTSELRSHRPGDSVELVILRGEQELTLPVELGTDFGTGRCRCKSDESPAGFPPADALQAELQAQAAEGTGGRRRIPPSTDRLSQFPNGGPGPRAQFEDRPADRAAP